MAPTDPYVGREILDGQFRVIERIGTGGMGAVYKAHQPSMDRAVAVKILHGKYSNRQDLVARFRREARAMSHLTHPNTCKVYLYGQLPDGSFYIVMEYLEGRNLGQIVRRDGPMDPLRAIGVLMQACGALHEAHTQGIIHRDLKPENIFLCTVGGIKDYAKVLDFGLAKVTARQMQPGSVILTQEGMVFGTPEFMSPEQAQGRTLDARSDVYSLAVILYELVTGKLPFEAKTAMEYVTLHVQASPIPLAARAPDRAFPAGLQDVMDRAMAKSPEERYGTALEFALALRECLTQPEQELLTRSMPAGTMPETDLASGVPSAHVSAALQSSLGKPTDTRPPSDSHSPPSAVLPAGQTRAGSGVPSTVVDDSLSKPSPPRMHPAVLVGIGIAVGVIAAVVAMRLAR